MDKKIKMTIKAKATKIYKGGPKISSKKYFWDMLQRQQEEEEASDKEETKSVKNENMTPSTLLQGSTQSKTPSKRIQKIILKIK